MHQYTRRGSTIQGASDMPRAAINAVEASFAALAKADGGQYCLTATQANAPVQVSLARGHHYRLFLATGHAMGQRLAAEK